MKNTTAQGRSSILFAAVRRDMTLRKAAWKERTNDYITVSRADM